MISELDKELRIKVNALNYVIEEIFFVLFNNLEIKTASLYLLSLYFINKTTRYIIRKYW